MYRTHDINTYNKMLEMNLDVELVPKRLLDVLLELDCSVAPRGKVDGEYTRYYLLGTNATPTEIATAIKEFNQDIKFKIDTYNKCFSSYKISIL